MAESYSVLQKKVELTLSLCSKFMRFKLQVWVENHSSQPLGLEHVVEPGTAADADVARTQTGSPDLTGSASGASGSAETSSDSDA